MKITVTLNQTAETFPRAVNVEMEELIGKSITETRDYINDKVKQWVAETVNFTWTVDLSRDSVTEREQVAA